jgi:hypothetical protein
MDVIPSLPFVNVQVPAWDVEAANQRFNRSLKRV